MRLTRGMDLAGVKGSVTVVGDDSSQKNRGVGVPDYSANNRGVAFGM